jgi:6-phosphogluconolactonase (cycloisomerase 2 family)
MRLITSCQVLMLLQSHATAMRLFVASYGVDSQPGRILSLALNREHTSFSINITSSLNTKTSSPGWLTLDRKSDLLYLVDEAVGKPQGTLVTYELPDGGLKEIHRIKIRDGGVAATPFANGRGLAIPQYTAGSMQIFDISSPRNPMLLDTIDFRQQHSKGPIIGRQDEPHPHHAVLDPTRRFLLVPDLGSDKVHVFAVDDKSLTLEQRSPIAAPHGSGPRHGAFWKSDSEKTVFYLVGELDSTVIVYDVEYGTEGGKPDIKFQRSAVVATIDKDKTLPHNTDGSTKVPPAEIAITVRIPCLQLHRHVLFRLARHTGSSQLQAMTGRSNSAEVDAHWEFLHFVLGHIS